MPEPKDRPQLEDFNQEADYSSELGEGFSEASSIEELEAAYSPEYLADCADGDARQERLEELKRRIALDAYKVDSDRIAEELLSKADLSKS